MFNIKLKSTLTSVDLCRLSALLTFFLVLVSGYFGSRMVCPHDVSDYSEVLRSSLNITLRRL